MRDFEGVAGLEALAEADRALRPASGRALSADMQACLLEMFNRGKSCVHQQHRRLRVRSNAGWALSRGTRSYTDATTAALWTEGLLDVVDRNPRGRVQAYELSSSGLALAQALQGASHG